VSEADQRLPRTWVLWGVRAALALTVSDLAVGAILALIVRPQPRTFITDGPPPRVGWPQR
jgi:hypothetical protein